MDAFFLVTAEPGPDFEEVTTAPTSGMAPMIDYLYDLDFVKKDEIGVTGHSLGAKTANAVYAYYKIQELQGEVNKVNAVFLIGNQQLQIDGEWQEHLTYHPSTEGEDGPGIPLYYDVDYGVSAGKADENNYTTEAGGPWNFHLSNNARTFINELDQYDLQEGEAVEAGRYYEGTVQNSDEEYLRVLYQPNEIHMLNPYSLASNRNAVDFFQHAFTAPNPIDPNQMTMQFEQALNAFGIIGFFLCIYAFCRLLLLTDFFRPLAVSSIDEVFRPERPQRVIDKVYYWSFMIIGSVIPILWMMPLYMWIGGHKGPTFAARSLFGTVIWPQGNQLEQSFWMATAGLWTFLLFGLRYFFSMRKAGVNPSQWNLKISAKNLGRTVLLAVLAVGMGFGITFVAKYFFGSYFGLLNWVIRWPNSRVFLIALRYVPLFIFFYLANAFTQNIGRMLKDRPEWQNILLMCVINGLGLLLLWIYQYGTFAVVDKVPLNSARVMQTWSFFIVQSLCTIIARKFYLKTGKIYLGAFINALVFSMIACGHTMTLNVDNWFF